MMDSVLEQALVCDYNDQSMDALPINLWENSSFDSSMGVELQEVDDYQTPIWPTGPLDFGDDDTDDGSGGRSESALVVLHDPLITSSFHLTSADVMDCKSDRSFCNSGFSKSGIQQSTFSITFGSRGEVEITEDSKPLKGEMMSDMGELIVKTEPASPDSQSDHQAEDPLLLREPRKRTLPMPQIRTIKVKPQSNVRLSSSITTTTTTTPATPAGSGVFVLPPTPPSSTSSDNEGSSSPVRDESSDFSKADSSHEDSESPIPHRTTRANSSATTGKTSAKSNDPQSGNGYVSTASIRHPIHSPLISYQPKGSTGTLQLTEEEKRTLLSEGYPVPTRLPLTKAEEKSLKKIRRKIKNKISAQESRRKKKEYMDTLERRAQILADENSDYQQKLRQLEMDNAQLQSQLKRLQKLLIERQQIKDESQSPEEDESLSSM